MTIARLIRRWPAAVASDGRREGGSAIIEFVFVAVLVMVPLVYLIVAVATVQRNSLAVSNAAREAGRAFATADSDADAAVRARVAARLAMADQGIDGSVDLRYVPVGAGCASAPIVPQLRAGVAFTICVRRSFGLPAVPSVLSGRGITTVGAYTVYIDDFRADR